VGTPTNRKPSSRTRPASASITNRIVLPEPSPTRMPSRTNAATGRAAACFSMSLNRRQPLVST
jgi:hypothetical protein